MSGVILPGSRKRPLLNERHEPYDRVQLQRDILAALKPGPMERWRIGGVVHAADSKIIRELAVLKQANKIKRVGQRKGTYALASWQPPKATEKQRTFNDTPRGQKPFLTPKRKAPTSSWWAEAQTRDEFYARVHERAKEADSSMYGPTPDFGGE